MVKRQSVFVGLLVWAVQRAEFHNERQAAEAKLFSLFLRHSLNLAAKEIYY